MLKTVTNTDICSIALQLNVPSDPKFNYANLDSIYGLKLKIKVDRLKCPNVGYGT